MAASKSTLPSQRDFLRDNFVKLDNCGICMEPFGVEHQAASIKTPNCQHIFGYECLLKQINSNQENSNTCPLCREALFFKPDRPEFVEGPRDMDINNLVLHSVDNLIAAKKFLKMMWSAMYKIYERHEAIYDSDIEEQINSALAKTTKDNNPFLGMYIFSCYWPGIREMAKKMIGEHFEQGSYVPFGRMRRRDYMCQLWEVSDWKLEDKGSDEELPDDEMKS